MRNKQQILQDLKEARENRDIAQGRLNETDNVVSQFEEELIKSMTEDGLTQVKGAGLTATIGRSTVPTVRDWAALERYVLRHKALYLLERRVHLTAWREASATKAIPGIEPYERTRLTVKPSD